MIRPVKDQFERISLCPVALHTSAGEPVEFVFARAGIWISLHFAKPPQRSKSFIHRKALEIMPGSNALLCTECTEKRS